MCCSPRIAVTRPSWTESERQCADDGGAASRPHKHNRTPSSSFVGSGFTSTDVANGVGKIVLPADEAVTLLRFTPQPQAWFQSIFFFTFFSQL